MEKGLWHLAQLGTEKFLKGAHGLHAVLPALPCTNEKYTTKFETFFGA
jgi:hypothetical protein